MSEPVLGEIIMVGFDFAPPGYALCDGQMMSVSENQELYSLLGTTYGGDGVSNFALPDLRGRVPVAATDTIARGTQGGAESHVLSGEQMPEHSHPMLASSDPANTTNPTNSLIAPTTVADGQMFIKPGADFIAMGSQCIGETGGGQAHNNVQPSMVINFCIAIAGTLPPATPPSSN